MSEGFAENVASDAPVKGRWFESVMEAAGRIALCNYIFLCPRFCSRYLIHLLEPPRPEKRLNGLARNGISKLMCKKEKVSPAVAANMDRRAGWLEFTGRLNGNRRFSMKGLAIWLLCALPLFGQSHSGELRLTVIDPAGLPVKTTVQIDSLANGYRGALGTNDQGRLDVKRLPYGVYRLEITQSGFAQVSESVEIHSSIPAAYSIQLTLSKVDQSVNVSADNTLTDPDQPGSVSQVGSEAIQTRLSSIPGRSIQELVNSQPGWLYEGNAVLHPRGSEYQTQFVVDGIPLTDNRSPSFGPAIDADDVQSLSIYTAGIPAEYGRKMGGVVEVNTLQDSQPGFHGQVVLSGGSFDSAGASAQGQYVWGKNVFGGSASGSMTDHYLNL